MLVSITGVAFAGDGDPDPIVVTAPEGPDPLAVPAAVTVIPVDASVPASADLATLVDQAPGAHVSHLGGLGDWSAVSVRGSSLRSVIVALDGVPLNPDGAAATNLAELPLAGIARIEVWRGGAPFSLAASPIGGTVDLITARPAVRVSASVGSHGTTRLAATGGRSDPDVLVVADAFATRGDYRWYDDGATLYDASDDALRRRANNDKAQLSGLVRVRREGAVDLGLLATVLDRTEGLPGHSGDPTVRARLDTERVLLAGTAAVARDEASVRVRAWGTGREETLDDRAGEIGLSSQWQDSVAGSLGLHADGTWIPAAGVALRGVAEVRQDAFATAVHGARPSGADVRRAGALGAGGDLSWRSLVVSPAVQASTWSARHDGAIVPLGSIDPRVGASVRRGPVAVRATLSRSLRPPDAFELFGDRGFVVGNPALRPERAVGGDVGVVLRTERGSGEITAFGSRLADAIVWTQNGQRTFVATNLGAARIGGVEAAAVVAWDVVDLDASATYTATRNDAANPVYAGNQLPRVPRWDGSARASWHPGPWRLSASLSATAGNFWDATNWFATPPRLIGGASAAYTRGAATVSIDVLDVADRIVARVPANPLDPGSPRVPAAVTDYGGFPLAGRTVILTMRWGAR